MMMMSVYSTFDNNLGRHVTYSLADADILAKEGDWANGQSLPMLKVYHYFTGQNFKKSFLSYEK